jgi:hypothetical protein
MTHWKDERRISQCLDQLQISARFVGNPTIALAAVLGRPPQNFQEIVRCLPIATRFPDPIVSCYQLRSESETQLTLARRLAVNRRRSNSAKPSYSRTMSTDGRKNNSPETGRMPRLSEETLRSIVLATLGSIPGLLKLVLQEIMKPFSKKNRSDRDDTDVPTARG